MARQQATDRDDCEKRAMAEKKPKASKGKVSKTKPKAGLTAKKKPKKPGPGKKKHVVGKDVQRKRNGDSVVDRSWHAGFLTHLRKFGNVASACEAVKTSRTLAYSHRDQFPDFKAAWEEAIEESTEWLEAAAIKRGMTKSDTLLIFMLKSRKPDVYRETKGIEHSGPKGQPIQIGNFDLTKLDNEQLKQLEAILEAAEPDGDPSGAGA